MNLVWVFIGGGLGSSLRFIIGRFFAGSSLLLPVATLCSNLISCLIFAFSLWLFQEKINSNPNIKLFILTGICGGLSTFSTFSYETFELLKQHEYAWAGTNIAVSVLTCLAIFFIFMSKIS